MRTRLPAQFVYLASEAAIGFFFRVYTVIFSVFLIREVGLDPLQLVLMGTALEGTYLVFQVPTGVLADVVSRRASIVFGTFLTGAAFALLAFAHGFGTAALSQVLWGFGATFSDGADVAWITDEVGEAAARGLYLRAGQVFNIGGLLGIVTGVVLATLRLRLPVLVSGIGMMAVAVTLAFVMPEEHHVKREADARVRHSMRDTFGKGFRTAKGHPVLLLILGVAALHGMSTEGFDRLADLHLLRDIGLPSFWSFQRIVWFAVIDVGALLLGIGATEYVKRRVDLEGHAPTAKVMLSIDVSLIALVVAFGLVGGFAAALLAFWAVGGLRNVRDSVFHAWINRGLDPTTRATINSMGGQADAIGQTAGGPILGSIARSVSTVSAIVAAGLIPLPSLVLYARTLRSRLGGPGDGDEGGGAGEAP